MSSQIFYHKAFIKVYDKYVPMINQGSTNCWELGPRGRHIPEKEWSVLKWFQGRLLLNKHEMGILANSYEVTNQTTGIFLKSRNKPFLKGELEKWILAGMKNACTVEEYLEHGNRLCLYDEEDSKTTYINSTVELINLLEKMQGRESVDLMFANNRELKRPPRSLQVKQKEDCYYVLKCDTGFLATASMSGLVRFCYRATDKMVRRFKTEQSASNFLDRYERVLGKVGFGIRYVENGRLL